METLICNYSFYNCNNLILCQVSSGFASLFLFFVVSGYTVSYCKLSFFTIVSANKNRFLLYWMHTKIINENYIQSRFKSLNTCCLTFYFVWHVNWPNLPADVGRHMIYKQGEQGMLETIIVILLVLWLLGVVTSTGGNLIYLLLVAALVVFVIRLISGRKVV